MDHYQHLAEILLDTAWNSDSLQQVLSQITTPTSTARKQLGTALLSAFQIPPSRRKLIGFLSSHSACTGISKPKLKRFRLRSLAPLQMRTAVAASFATNVIPFPTIQSFAEWLDNSVGLIGWLSNHRKNHYHISTTPKRSGGLRIVEAPRARLKAVQRQIAREILQSIPCHESVHGFVPGRSALTYVQPHVGKPIVLRMDLKDFFPSIDASRVFGLFRSLGYPYPVTQLLTDLCTSECGMEQLGCIDELTSQFGGNVESVMHLRSLYCRKHLPQGAATSPSIANLIAFSLDRRLTGLAKSVGLEYTRYADDLLFSGSKRFGHFAKSFSVQVAAIAMEEGFQVQFRKTRIMRSGVRQSAAGIVLNRVTNLKRNDYDRLKAILTNCVRFGASTQNREGIPNFEAHLRGRVNWVRQLNPARGEKLASLIASIDWT